MPIVKKMIGTKHGLIPFPVTFSHVNVLFIGLLLIVRQFCIVVFCSHGESNACHSIEC